MTRTRAETRAYITMQNLLANGWQEEALIVDTAAQVIGGDEAAKVLAQRVWDKHFKIHGAN
jgi:hypothetical protein